MVPIMEIKDLIQGECEKLLRYETTEFINQWITNIRSSISKEQEDLVDQKILRGACIYRHPPYSILYNNIETIRNGIPILDFEDCRLIISIILDDGLYVEYNSARMKLTV